MFKSYVAVLAVTAAFAPAVFAATEADKRLDAAADLLTDMMQAKDKGIPQELLNRSQCVILVPGLKKAALGFGGKFGRGFAMCRHASGSGWSAPAAIRVEGGSVGFQIGGSSTDLVMLVMNASGANKLLEDKFTVGGEGSVAAGPVGRTATAQTDAQMHAEILSWSRTQGLFAGISVQGATLRQDLDDNTAIYGKRLTNRSILTSGRKVPATATKLINMLNRYSFREQR